MKRRTIIWTYPLIIMGLALILTNSCKKKDNNNSTSTGQVPVLTTSAVSGITQATATCGGNITSDGGAAITARGVCWSTAQTPTIADSKTTDATGTGTFTSAITGLTPNTTYYVRAYATNSAGTGYGSALSFTTQQIVTDIDGNVYGTVIIGTQVWMAENLKVTHYRNGDPIPNAQTTTAWVNTSTGAYCEYDNSSVNGSTYGKLYNWLAVNDSRKIAPIGWHVPTDAEWTTLTSYLGGESVAGGKLKETGLTHWASPNTGATNETGYTALPAGWRSGYTNASFMELGSDGKWWCSTESDNINAIIRGMWSAGSNVNGGSSYPQSKWNGFSVRCVKD